MGLLRLLAERKYPFFHDQLVFDSSCIILIGSEVIILIFKNFIVVLFFLLCVRFGGIFLMLVIAKSSN